MNASQKVKANMIHLDITQGWATSVLEGHCPTEFSFNPNQTHQLIKVFRITRKLQAVDLRVGAKLCRTLALQDRRYPFLI